MSLVFTPLQERILSYRNHVFGIMSTGGRGSGKSVGACGDLLDYAATWATDAAILVVREQFAALQELQDRIYALCVQAFPGTTRNKNENVIYAGNGAAIYFANCSDEESINKSLGRSFGFCLFDECGNYTPRGWKNCQTLRANLRTKPGQPVRIHATCNPQGRLHNLIYKTFILKSPPWAPFVEEGTGLLWIWTASDLTQNPHINPEQYERQIIAATASDPEKQKAWRTGNWSPMGGGAMFQFFDAQQHCLHVPAGTFLGPTRNMMSLDFGISAPSVILVGTKLYERRAHVHRGSILIRAEHATVEDWMNLEEGDGTPPDALARIAADLGRKYKAQDIVADDYKSWGPDQTVIKILNKEPGLNAFRPEKDRCGGWALINQMLQNTLRGEGAGLYIDPSCRYLLETIVSAFRDEHKREDISTKYHSDHALDALNCLTRELGDAGARGNGRVIGAW